MRPNTDWHSPPLIALACAAMLWVATLQNGTYPLSAWLIAMGAPTLALLWCAARAEAPSMMQVLLWALALRLACFVGNPQFEDDFHRYLWDGYRTLIDGKPYNFAPSYFFATDVDPAMPPKLADTLSKINHPDIHTIYGPALQWLFAVSAAIAPAEIWPLRLIWLAVDMALVVSIARHTDLRYAMLYALCPLVLHEVGVAIHPDGLIGALIYFAYRAATQQRIYLMAVCIGSAAAMKIHALLALPFLLAAFAFTVPNITRAVLAVAATYLVFWAPFLVSAGAFSAAWGSFSTFARDWQFNPLGFAVIEALAGSAHARVLAASLMLACWAALFVWLVRRQAQRPQAILVATSLVAAFAILLFFSPVINAWYLLWLLPIATQTRWFTPWGAAFILPISYVTHFNLDVSSVPYTLPTVVAVMEWAVVLICSGLDWRRHRRGGDVAAMPSQRQTRPD